MITYDKLTEENFFLTSLDSFVFLQEVRECWRCVDGGWKLLPIAYTDDSGPDAQTVLAALRAGNPAFGAWKDGKLAGFAMVNDYPEAGKTDYCVSEFFVMHKYRRCGLGKWAAFQLFDRFQGTWQLKRHPGNLPSVAFWDRVVGEYTGGHFRLESMGGEIAYPDGSPADVFFFDTGKNPV